MWFGNVKGLRQRLFLPTFACRICLAALISALNILQGARRPNGKGQQWHQSPTVEQLAWCVQIGLRNWLIEFVTATLSKYSTHSCSPLAEPHSGSIANRGPLRCGRGSESVKVRELYGAIGCRQCDSHEALRERQQRE